MTEATEILIKIKNLIINRPLARTSTTLLMRPSRITRGHLANELTHKST